MSDTKETTMYVPTYPKIETLYVRDERTHKVTDEIRCPEFAAVNRWTVTEKIDGTNIRVAMLPDGTVFYGGRTNEAQMQVSLVTWLRDNLPYEKLKAAFTTDDGTMPVEVVTLFGEGYGEKIQKGGGNYRKGVSFRLFDVMVGRWWLKQSDVEDVADKLGIDHAPVLGVGMTIEQAERLVRCPSTVGELEGGLSFPHEGIVARSDPLMLMRNGDRVMWKLKARDFDGAKA